MQDFGLDWMKLRIEYPCKGHTFTVCRVRYESGDGNGEKPVVIIAEGVARRSPIDPPDELLGAAISQGRALKALKKKLKHETIRHHMMG